MSIITAELKVFKAAQVSATPSANGGRASYLESVSGVNQNLFPDVSQSERLAGSTVFRKAFFKNLNAADLALYNSRVFVENYTPGDDAAYFHAGSQTDLQSDLTGSELLFGAGKLDLTTAPGASQVKVLLENIAVQPFRDGDLIRVSDKPTIDGSGNEEWVTVSGAPAQVGSVVTLNITPVLVNGYNASNTRVANVYEFGDLKGTVSNFSVTTVGSGDYDNITQPITCPNVGGVYDDWTVTFTSATAYGVVGTREGSVGSGSTLSDFAPNNPSTSSPFFNIKSAGFSGTWQAGDTLVFRTTPAHIPLWLKRIVPAGAAALAADKVILALDGETA
jgi:hypothetical protein